MSTCTQCVHNVSVYYVHMYTMSTCSQCLHLLNVHLCTIPTWCLQVLAVLWGREGVEGRKFVLQVTLPDFRLDSPVNH